MTKQERAARTRGLLIASAAKSFYEQGYPRTNLNAVSARIGVSSGALYFHFENKAALALAVEAEACRALRAVARRARRRDCALQSLVDTTHALAELLRTSTVAKAGFQLGSDDFEGVRQDLRREWQGCVRRLLNEAAQERTLGPELPRQVIASSIVAATVGFELLGRGDLRWLSRESITGFWQLHLPCLATPDVAGRLDPAGTVAAQPAAPRTPGPPAPLDPLQVHAP